MIETSAREDKISSDYFPGRVEILKSRQRYLKFAVEFWITVSEKDDSRKDAKQAKFGENRKLFFFAPWRLGAIHIVEVVLLNI